MKASALFIIGVLMFGGTLRATSLWDFEPQKVRELINQKIMLIPAETPAVHTVTDMSIKEAGKTVPVRIYTPCESHNLPLLLLIHGGGWVAGNLETHDNMARYLCQKAQAVVISVGYSNSPEGKFPLPLEQCYATLLWVQAHAQEFGASTTRLVVVGDSAGGNMAASLCLLARDRQGPKIDLQILINPSPDLTGGGTLKPQGNPQDAIRWFATQYVHDPKEVTNPYVSPFFAQDLTHLPPALVILAELDELYEDGKKYADRLNLAGVKTTIYVQKGIGHLAGNGARASSVARESLDIAAVAIGKI